jgi:serine/threonine protein kinase
MIDNMPDCVSPAMDEITRALRVGNTLILPVSDPAADTPEAALPLAKAEPAQTDSPSAPPRVAEYEILELLGAGGMGMVFKARHIWLDKIVAIKLLAEGTFRQPHAVARFLREAQMTAGLDHPNIVRATDAGEVSGVHYMVTELVVGQDLARIVQRGGRLSVADACAITCQVASALQYAHEKGLVHRDIKPSNLMLTLDDERRGSVKVLDFGLARLGADQDTLTAAGHVLGTLDFMAPEQASDPRRVDTRADIYSLGCTLYYLLAGEPPFAGAQFDSAASKLRAHLQTPPPDLRRSRRDVPAAVLDCLQIMLAKEPAERFASPQKIVRKLARFTADADLARLLDATVTTNQCRKTRAWSIGSALLAVVVLPWTLLCGLGKALTYCTGALCTTPRESTRRREPLFSFGGLLMLLGLVAFLAMTGFSCVPREHLPPWDATGSGNDLPQPVTWEAGETLFSWE